MFLLRIFLSDVVDCVIGCAFARAGEIDRKMTDQILDQILGQEENLANGPKDFWGTQR